MPFKILHTNISNKTVIACNLSQIEIILVFKWSLLKDDKHIITIGSKTYIRLQWKLLHFFAKYKEI